MKAVPRWQKAGFAVLAVGILFGALVAQVDNDRRIAGTNPGLDPRVVTIDLDFLAADGSGKGGFYSLGPLGQVEIGRDPSQRFIKYTSGLNSVALVSAGTSYSGLDWWKGEAGSRPATTDGVHARFEHLFPSTAADIVAGIDGVEFTLEIRSRPLVGVGALSYDFWLDASPGLIPAQAGRPLLASNAGVATVRGSVPIVDGAGRTVFVLTPATAFVDFQAAPGPAVGRSASAYEAAFPAHEQGERQSVSLEYRLERVGSRTKVSVVLPADLFLDPAIEWPVRVDPGITNPIANSSYFADETILMDSDLVVTSTGAAQFSNVTLIMNRTASPNYNISVSAGGRMTLLSSTVKSNDSALPYRFTVNGSFTAQDTLIQHANDGLQLLGDSSSLSNVTLQNGSGRALVLQGGNLTASRLDLKSAASTGLFTTGGDLQVSFMNVTSAGGEGVYINATSGNITQSHVVNATLNGAKVVNGSRINLTLSEFSGSGRNGVLIIGGAPSIENSSVTGNNWSGVALFDDHSAYLYGNRIASNNWSGVEMRLNSTADLYSNLIEGNGKAGVRAVAADPNVELNTISGNEEGVWLEGAHNAGGKPGADASTEDGYSYIMTASAELGDGERMPLVAGVSISHQGPSTQSDVPPGTIQFPLTVTNTDTAPPPVPISLSIDDDESAWASLDTTSVMLGGGQSQTVTLTVQVPSGASTGTTYGVLVWANETAPPFPQANVWAYVDLQDATTLQVADVTVPNQTTVGLSAILTTGAGPVQGKTVAFKLEGNWIGEATTDSGGAAILQYTLSQPPLTQTLEAYFNGTQYLVASTDSATVHINFTYTYLQVSSLTGRWGDPVSLTARLEADPGPGHLVARWVHFGMDGSYLGKAMTNGLGYATWTFANNYSIADHTWNVSYDGDIYSGASSNSSTFSSLKEMTVMGGDSFTIRQGETPTYTATLTDDEGFPLSGKDVNFWRGSDLLATVATGAAGTASYADTAAASLGEGNYSLNYSFAADSYYLSIQKQTTLTIRRWSTHFEIAPPTQYWGDTVALTAQLRDEDGNNLSSRTVKAYAAGVLIGETTTNATGWATVNDSTVREVDTYNMSFYYAGSTRDFQVNTTSNLTVVREVTWVSALVDARIMLGSVLTIQIRLTEDDGVALSRPINVTLFGGIYFNGTTDANGFLNVTFDSRGMIPQRYVLWYFFDGEEHHAPSQAYTRIVVEYDADFYGNRIEGNGVGVLANNSSSKLVESTITGNGVGVSAANGSLLVYNSSVGLSTSFDYQLLSGGSIYSTNTTFNRGKVDFQAGAVLLHVRFYLFVRAAMPSDPTLQTAYTLRVENVTGATIYNQSETTGLFVRVLVTQYTQDATGRVTHTAHRIFTQFAGVTIVMDATKKITVYQGPDADLDGLPNDLEDAQDVYWLEAEGHVAEYTQLVDDSDASQGKAAAPLSGDLAMTDPGSFTPVVAGTYILLLRAKGGAAAADLRVTVKGSGETELANVTFTPDTRYRWFQTTEFAFASDTAPLVNITALAAGGAEGALRLDEIALARIKDNQSVRLRWPGLITNALDADMDFDRGADGAETHPGTYWLEAETLPDVGAARWMPDRSASNSAAAVHANGNDTVANFSAAGLPYAGVYETIMRAKGNGSAGEVTAELWRNGSLVRNETVSFPNGVYAFATFLFDHLAGANETLVLRDTADTSPALNASKTWVDKFALVAQRAWPSDVFGRLNSSAYVPAAGTNPVFANAGPGIPETGDLYWVSDDTLYSMPYFTALWNDTVQVPFTVDVGPGATQPIVFKTTSGSQYLALSANSTVQVFNIPLGPQPVWTFTLPSQTLNPIAYANGWVVFTTLEGAAWGLELDGTGLHVRWTYDPSLGPSLSTPTIYNDKAYFGFSSGLIAVNYNLTGPSKIAWTIGANQWPDPRDHCPAWVLMNSSCSPPGTYPLTTRAVAAAPAGDSGSLYVLAYNESEADLYRFTEDGEVVWAVDLQWQMAVSRQVNRIAPQIMLREKAVVVSGPVVSVIDGVWGNLLMAHNFNYSLTAANFTASPIVTEHQVLAAGTDGWYAFALLDGEGWGQYAPTDGDYTLGAMFPEDLLWQFTTDQAPSAQPLLGDFDGTGMRDLILSNATSIVTLKDFESGHRNYIELAQLGRDAAHDGNLEFLYPFVATDPLDPDMDFDNVTDAFEVSGFFVWQSVEAEDAESFLAWAQNDTAGGMKNFNFFHETGVTLTADDGNVTKSVAPNNSWLRFGMGVEDRAIYRMTLISNTSITNIQELRFESGNATNATDPDTSQGYGVGLNNTNRTAIPTEIPAPLNASQLERVRQIVENATYLKVRYQTFDPTQAETNFTAFGVKHDTSVSVYKSVFGPSGNGSLWLSVFLSMQIDFELLGGSGFGPRAYEFEVGLNLSLVNMSAVGGSALPANLELLRILDLDRMKFERRGLDPFTADSDSDGVKDGDEALGIPLNPDADEDGLSDYYETQVYHTNPADRDSDHDGIRDRVEVGLTGDTDAYTVWDSTASWASYPEYMAAKFRGDPFFKMPDGDRVLSNNDQDTSTHTDPLNGDSDGDGIPDGWVDGWIYDPSFMIGQIQHTTNSTEYLTRAAPQDYNLWYWRQSGIYDNFAQIWEGEDANLDGRVDGNQSSNDTKEHWAFWPSITDTDGNAENTTLGPYIRKGWGETDAAKPDTDDDGVPEGYEVWYATRSPIYVDPVNETYYFTPVSNDSQLDVDSAYGPPRIVMNLSAISESYKESIAAGTGDYLAQGMRLWNPVDPETQEPNPEKALLATVFRLNMSASAAPASVTLEVWQGPTSTSVPARFLVAAAASVPPTPSWVEFDIPDTWLNFSSDHYYIALKNASCALTWWDANGGDRAWVTQSPSGQWSSGGQNLSWSPGLQVIDAFSQDGDGLTNLEEYLVGSNPKKRDTDAGTTGPNSNFGDLLSDGQEMINHTIYRTNATLGGIVSTYYNASSWILLDESLMTVDLSDWMYFEYLEAVEDPNATFAGAKGLTSYLFTLADGSELRINATANRLYIYLPGADFETLINETDHANTTSRFEGEALVFYQLNASAAPDAYKTNAIWGSWSDKWLFFQKQFYASDPFDWDTDDDGLADGWEVDPWNDTDLDFVPNVRDFDSDNDGLTDGQEMLQVQWDWIGEFGTTAANVKFDPDGDGKYAMVDTESDGDGIADAKEVLWSVDTDSDNRINLVDWDSDGDGLCDGWCTTASTASWRTDTVQGWTVTLPPGMPNGEDTNQNGTNEQGESSPVKVDTDGDRLWDGYAYAVTAAGWQLTQVDGKYCPIAPTPAKLCGEESTYSLYNGSYSSKTNRTNPDADGDGLTDLFEVHGWAIRYVKVDQSVANNYTVSNPNLKDSDGDGIADATELVLGTNTTYGDTDIDGVADGTEDRNRDGFRQTNETSAIEQDSDRDLLCDGLCAAKGEDTDFDGQKDSTETDPLNADTDGDKTTDGPEYDRMLAKDAGWGLAHDYDLDGLTDLNDKDSDNDGLTDTEENYDRDNVLDAKETDPYNNDTDGDLLFDGAEPSPFEDTDSDGNVNGRDQNSNNDNYNDNLQVWVVFRTNAVAGAYSGSSDVWVAVVAPSVNPYFPEQFDFSSSVALYRWQETLASPAGAANVSNPYGPLDNIRTVAELKTPEGYPVQFAGPTSGAYDIYIQVSASRYEHFVDSTSAPSDWSSSNRTVQSFLANRQETYDGRVAVDMDPDFDDITTPAENACGMNPNSNDTDGDGIRDGIEYRGCADFDGTGGPDANDTDADEDGILDNLEDKDLNGRLDSGETDARGLDTDSDGIYDGTEDADLDGTRDATETSPIDRDTDDDGIPDKAEVDGTWCYIIESTSICNAADHNARKTGAVDTDSDDDGVWDGQEIGLSSPGKDTLTTAFRGDANPSTVTDPKKADSDGDGIKDGTEDLNVNGRVDSGEADPVKWDTDGDALPDGWVDFGTAGQGLCTGTCLGGSWGEDQDLDGTRDQDADGNWTEADFLANDSDVDGILDGSELWGRWCYKTETPAQCAGTTNSSSRQLWVASPLKNGALVADFDGDGLRDGQELAGWKVGIWYERTMEAKTNYTVTSDPKDTDTEATGGGDGLTDFEEFMNGSDPTLWDTDGDGLTDPVEIARKSNITGIEGTPPQIANVSLQVGIDWDWWGFLYLPLRSHVTVSFDVSDNVGVGRVDVKFIRYSGTESVHLEWTQASAPLNYHFSHRFDFSIAEALVAGADVNITAFDVNENGAWGDFHIKSILEAIADAIAAFLSAIAKVILEAVSAAINWIWGMISGAMAGVLDPILAALNGVGTALVSWIGSFFLGDIEDQLMDFLEAVSNHPFLLMVSVLSLIIRLVSTVTSPFLLLLAFLFAMLLDFIVPFIIEAVVGALVSAPGLGSPLGLVDETLSKMQTRGPVELWLGSLLFLLRILLLGKLLKSGHFQVTLAKINEGGVLWFVGIFFGMLGMFSSDAHTAEDAAKGFMFAITSLGFTAMALWALGVGLGHEMQPADAAVVEDGMKDAKKPSNMKALRRGGAGGLLILEYALYNIVLPILSILVSLKSFYDSVARFNACSGSVC